MNDGILLLTGAQRRHAARHSSLITLHLAIALLLAIALGGCGTTARREPATKAPPSAPAPRAGGYYLDDGPGPNPPADLDSIPDAVPRIEPVRSATSRPYVVMGRTYAPMTTLQPYKGRGIATWYGRRYHGKQTSSGEIYDMYSMSAAHTILPIPSYARVTNLANGKSVVVRVNDRGPFVEGRVIDLSYTAAHRIGVLAGGSAMVEVEALIPDGTGTVAAAPAQRVPAPPASNPEGPPVTAARDPEPVAVPPLPAEPAPASAPTAKPQVPIATEAGGYYLQLGAFGSKENAETFLMRMRTQVDWLASTLHIYTRDGLFRVHAGPYANQAEARAGADRISQALGLRPFVLTR
jgi:rare lipoprotein A